MTTTSALTHFDAHGQAHMVDVAAKASTHRIAIAQGRISMAPATLAIILPVWSLDTRMSFILLVYCLT